MHMVGIGGAGMSGIARILLDRGGAVSGSDAKESRGVLALRARGALDPYRPRRLGAGPAARRADRGGHHPRRHPEDQPGAGGGARRGIPVIMRPVVLAKLMAGHRTLMVTGTHGKTTTTSMLMVALQHSGFDPSFAVGGDLGEAGTNAHHGSGDCFVAEADESDGSLLEYSPDVAVVTNIEADHLDFFGSAEAYVRGLRRLRRAAETRWRAGGVRRRSGRGGAWPQRTRERWVSGCCGYGSERDPAAGRRPGGLGAAGHRRGGARFSSRAKPHPRVMRLAVPGRHMALNALGALLAAIETGAQTRHGARRPGRFRGRAPAVRAGRHRQRRAGLRRLRPPSDRGARHADAVRAVAAAGRPGPCRAGRSWCSSPICTRGHRLSPREFGAGAQRGRRGVRARRLCGTRDNRWPG